MLRIMCQTYLQNFNAHSIGRKRGKHIQTIWMNKQRASSHLIEQVALQNDVQN